MSNPLAISTVTLPSAAITSQLKGSVWTVLVYLASLAPDPQVRSVDIADAVGLTDLTVRRALGKLEGLGWIAWRRHKSSPAPLDLDLLWLSDPTAPAVSGSDFVAFA